MMKRSRWVEQKRSKRALGNGWVKTGDYSETKKEIESRNAGGEHVQKGVWGFFDCLCFSFVA